MGCDVVAGGGETSELGGGVEGREGHGKVMPGKRPWWAYHTMLAASIHLICMLEIEIEIGTYSVERGVDAAGGDQERPDKRGRRGRAGRAGSNAVHPVQRGLAMPLCVGHVSALWLCRHDWWLCGKRGGRGVI